MPRQDSAQEQLKDLAENVRSSLGTPAEEWILEGKNPPTREECWKIRKLAVRMGCYDADDILKDRMFPELRYGN